MKRHPASAAGRRGAASLIVVMVLFFVISLVAAYTSRNMIFEQRTSANQYRSTQAFEAAEGGVEWALAQLNGGLIDINCQPLTSTSGSNFRTRMLDINPLDGTIKRKEYLPAVPYNPMCVATSTGWSCVCPDSGTPTPTLSAVPATELPAPAFRLTFSQTLTRPGVVRLISQSCTRLDPNCLGDASTGEQGDAVAVINVFLAIKGGIASAPLAALTSGGQVNLSGTAPTTLVNSEPATDGITVDARGTVSFNPAAIQVGVDGSPVAPGTKPNDSTMPTSADRMFASVFGMRREAYRLQPATIVLTCTATSNPCTAANLAAVAARNPGRVLWLDGDAALDNTTSGTLDIGSTNAPVVVVSQGQLTKSAGSNAIRVFGFVYQFDASGHWTTAGDLYIQGATVAEGDVLGTGSPTLVYDLGILNRLRLTGGSFVRVPGSWRDTQ